MRLYELTWGPFPRRVVIYLAEKGITDIERVPLDVLTGEHKNPDFLRKNPLGQLPVLEVQPDIHISQSLPIIEYLEERFPEPNLIGSTPLERARTRELIALIADTYAFFSSYAKHASPAMAGFVEQHAQFAAAYRREYLAALKSLEIVASGAQFLCGERLTIADCIFFSSAQFAHLFYDVELPEDCSKLRTHYGRFSARRSAQPASFPDSVYPSAKIPRSAR